MNSSGSTGREYVWLPRGVAGRTGCGQPPYPQSHGVTLAPTVVPTGFRRIVCSGEDGGARSSGLAVAVAKIAADSGRRGAAFPSPDILWPQPEPPLRGAGLDSTPGVTVDPSAVCAKLRFTKGLAHSFSPRYGLYTEAAVSGLRVSRQLGAETGGLRITGGAFAPFSRCALGSVCRRG